MPEKKQAEIDLLATVKPITDAEFRAFVKRSPWTFAKTMRDCPHWYTVRKQAFDDHLFNNVVMHIRQHGYKERFKRSYYIRYNLDEFKYWTMGAPLNITIIINRAFIIEPPDPQLPLT
jgi:hypothetical protein